MTATVVLVHGAWHGAWCWRDVVARLEQAGVPAVAVDLPGHGASPLPFTDLHGDAAAVTEAIDRAGGPVVLCGHSYGGAVVTEAGTHPAVRRLVYLCAFNLDDGECCAAAAPDIQAPAHDLVDALQFSDDGAVVTFDPDRAADVFYGACSPEDAAWATGQLGAHPLVTLNDTPSAVAWHTKPSTYVVCTEDNAVHPELQRVLATRATNTIEWEADHAPFLSRPELAAALLIDLANEHAS
jgi:pimeloyl-ACP methyl ester carboxylesterase